jgi:DNA (cytosine-5)-methyltransferase 1
MEKLKIVSFFSGAGGLDLGFTNAGFDVIWANEYDKKIWKTFEFNHPNTILDKRSIVDIPSDEVPDCDGIIGGPPCQSWSEAGAKRGINDKRGQLFFEFIRILADKKPKFFLAENVSGMLLPAHKMALENIKKMFTEIGYNLSFKLINVSDYGIPQDRKRVFFIGYRKDLKLNYHFPEPTTPNEKITLKETINDLTNNAIPSQKGNYSNGKDCKCENHEYMTGGFSSIFMSRNRVRAWNEVSFTIQAGGRHAPIHPQAPKMKLVDKNIRKFEEGKENLYRRLSIRECARIQTFPDKYIFFYENLVDGYKMVGNAVPVEMAKVLATKILNDLKTCKQNFKYTEPIFNEISSGKIVIQKMNEIINSIAV